jgi:hypothetical protein
MSACHRMMLCACAVVLLSSLESIAWGALSATPASLTFTTVQGAGNPSSQIVNVLKDSRASLSWSASNYAPWLRVTPNSGSITTSAQVNVSVEASGLAAGSYSTTLKVMTSRGGKVRIPVTLTVKAGGGGASNTAATLTWSSNTETDLVGYKVYIGTAPGVYSTNTPVGMVASYTFSNLALGTTYYFAVSACDTSGNESALSPAVSKSIY